MEIDLPRCSLVLAGAWNVAILNPSWVGAVLFGNRPVLIELMLGDIAWRFTEGSTVVEVADQRVQIRPVTASDEAFGAAENLALTLLDTLPETPVRAVGLNFGFRLVGDLGADILERETVAAGRVEGVLRALRVQETFEVDGHVINLNLVREDIGGAAPTTRVELNHHEEVSPLVSRQRGRLAALLLRGRTLVAKELSYRIVEQRYRLATHTLDS